MEVWEGKEKSTSGGGKYRDKHKFASQSREVTSALQLSV